VRKGEDILDAVGRISQAGQAGQCLPSDCAVVAQQHDRLEHGLNDAPLAENRVQHRACVAAPLDEARGRTIACHDDAITPVLLCLRERFVRGEPQRVHTASAG